MGCLNGSAVRRGILHLNIAMDVQKTRQGCLVRV